MFKYIKYEIVPMCFLPRGFLGIQRVSNPTKVKIIFSQIWKWQAVTSELEIPTAGESLEKFAHLRQYVVFTKRSSSSYRVCVCFVVQNIVKHTNSSS